MFILYSLSSGKHGVGDGGGDVACGASLAGKEMHNCQISAASILQSISARR